MSSLLSKRGLVCAVFVTFSCCFGYPSYSHSQSIPNDGSVLPFPPQPMDSVVKPRMQDSTMKWPTPIKRLPDGAPNVLIVMLDDVGFGVSEAFGGEVHTPTFSRLAAEGIKYNTFHTTSLCSPTRAAILTGRNQTRVGSGTIAERAVAFDGFTGIIPKEAATLAEVLKQYGYMTSAFGKWHNTPTLETSPVGPMDRWPTGYGFQHFYGFLAGETSQYEPRLVRNLDQIEPPQTDTYHLTNDLVDQALHWLDDRQSFSPDSPFLMYWAPGGVHGPHQVFPEWIAKYKGKFDEGWDAYRERVFQRQLEMGIIPPGTKLTPRDKTLDSWESIPEKQRAFQLRLMETFAGYVEHTDTQVGRLVDGLDARGLKENTIIFYIWGDNGSSAEGQRGSISELLAQNNIPNTFDQQIEALDKLGGLDALGSSKVDNMYHAGWAWAGGTPFKGTKQLASYFGGTRNPMVVSWPKRIKPSDEIRTQFHHVVDVAPTIYELLEITPPKVVNGHQQIPLDGISFAYTFDQAKAPSRKKVQFFDNNGSRAIYKDGWMACTFGPLIPWNTPLSVPRISQWDSAKDVWELYHLENDFSQANDLAETMPEKLEALKKDFLKLAADNQDFPIGAGDWLRIHPEDRVETSYTSWEFNQNTRRMPEFMAPGLGKQNNRVFMDIEIGDNANGVLYALGGASGGITVYLQDGYLTYLYNMLIIEQYQLTTDEPIAAGKHRIEVDTQIAGLGKSGTVVIKVDGKRVGTLKLKQTVPGVFTASETFDVGVDLGSTVSLQYTNLRPFQFQGKINKMTVDLK